ncbi:MAG: radical SAM protein [bacterium]|nr:radical SAM protein [bacterium]
MSEPPTRGTPAGPSVGVVFLQPQCNMTCTFCVTEDDFEPMRADDAVALLDHLVGRGVRNVVFGGGEPFAWAGDVVRLAREARARGLTVQVGTNGVALPEGYADLDCFDRWVLPLESTDPRAHDEMRRHGAGHHALVLERLRDLQRASRQVTVSTVLTAVNLPGLRELARFLADYYAGGRNVHAWHLYQFLPLGRGGRKNGDALSIPPETYAEACEELQRLDLPFRVFRRTDMYRSRTVEFFWSKDGHVVSGSEALHAEATRGTSGSATIL